MRGRRLDLAICGVLLSVAAVVHAPYVGAYFYFDDMNHLEAASRVHAGLDSWPRFLLLNHNEHLVPLFRLWWYATWRTCGLDYPGWAWQSIAVHGISACLLYVLLRRCLDSRIGAIGGALPWSAAALGGFDNQILWLASLHTSMSWTMVLAASIFATDFGTGRTLRSAVACAVCLLAAVLLQSSLVICLLGPAVLAAHRAWSARDRSTDPARRRRELLVWGFAWGVPVLVGAALQVLAMRQIETLASSSGVLQEPGKFLRWFSLVAIRATGSAFGLPAVDPGAGTIGPIPYAAATLVLFVATASTVDRRGIALLAAVGASALPVTAAAIATRLFLEASLVLNAGRYQYAATLFACTAAGVVVAGAARRTGASTVGRRMLAGTGVVAAILLVAVQHRAAERTVAAAAIGGFDLTRQQATAYVGVLDALSRRGVALGTRIEVPDIACNVGNMPNTLADFARMARPDGLPGIRFEEPHRIDWQRFRETCRDAGVAVLNDE